MAHRGAGLQVFTHTRDESTAVVTLLLVPSHLPTISGEGTHYVGPRGAGGKVPELQVVLQMPNQGRTYGDLG